MESNKSTKKFGKLIIISGPSGAGKTTLIRSLMDRIPTLAFSISATTRPMRKGEMEGVDYFFISTRKFNELIKNNAFIEWAKVHGNLYGTLKENVEKLREERKNVILDIDEQGASQVRKKKIPALLIYILPPSFKELEKRLKARNTELKKDMSTRLEYAKEQILLKGLYDHVIINDDMKRAVIKLRAIIYKFIKNR